MPLRRIALFLASFVLLSSFSLHAQDYELVLIPVVATGGVEGVGGARFSTSVSLMSAVDGVRYVPAYSFSSPAPATGTLNAFTVPIPPPFFTGPRSRAGRLLRIERWAADQVAIDAKLVSRRFENDPGSETTVPIVREDDFRTTVTHILGIRSAWTFSEALCPRTAFSRFRHTLRVYDVDARGNGAVLVRVYADSGNGTFSSLVQEATLPLDHREGDDSSFPAFGELTINEICRPFSCQLPCTGGPMRVEIAPLTPGLRFWPLVTETDNATHQVTLAYPQ